MTSTDRTTDGTAWSPSRRTLVRTAAWSVPAVSLVAAAPAFAGSIGTSRFTVTQTRYEVVGDPSSAEYRIDVQVSGVLPTPATIIWMPSVQGVNTVFEESTNLVRDTSTGDFYNGPGTWVLTGSTFWFRDTLFEKVDGGCTLQLLDGTTVVDTAVITYDSTLTPVPPPPPV